MTASTAKKRIKRTAAIAAVLILILIPAVIWIFGSKLVEPAPKTVGNCPNDMACENVEFPSESGSTIKGWYLRGDSGKGTVILMHGLRSNRLALVDRMRFLRRRGYSVLAFDFQGSGESRGDKLTFGHLERFDAEAAVRFARERRPDAKIGVVGISMGGAAFLLSKNMPQIDALVLELVYPALDRAVDNRMNQWFFSGADRLSGILTWQLRPRIGVSAEEMRPIDGLAAVKAPILVIAGEEDRLTTLEDSKQLFEAAAEPKEMWVVAGAGHADIWKLNTVEYENRVAKFFADKINEKSAPGGIDEKDSCNCRDDDRRKSGGDIDPGADQNK